MSSLSKNIHWIVIPSLLMVVFFLLLFLYSKFVGSISLNIGNDPALYSSFTVTGDSDIKNYDPNSPNTAAEQEARKQAYDNATEIANQLTSLAGKRLGMLTSISEYVDRNPQASSYSPTIEPPATSSSSFKVSITLTYQLK